MRATDGNYDPNQSWASAALSQFFKPFLLVKSLFSHVSNDLPPEPFCYSPAQALPGGCCPYDIPTCVGCIAQSANWAARHCVGLRCAGGTRFYVFENVFCIYTYIYMHFYVFPYIWHIQWTITRDFILCKVYCKLCYFH